MKRHDPLAVKLSRTILSLLRDKSYSELEGIVRARK